MPPGQAKKMMCCFGCGWAGKSKTYGHRAWSLLIFLLVLRGGPGEGHEHGHGGEGHGHGGEGHGHGH